MLPVNQICHDQTHRDLRPGIRFDGRTGHRWLSITLLLFILVSLTPLLMACRSQSVVASGSAGYRFVDDLGQDVILPYRPERVVAFTGSFAETWLLAGGKLAGVTSEIGRAHV